jgi:hypothetical protein
VYGFEIRIIKKSGAPVIYKAAVASALAAIRRAASLAEFGDLIEVWHGLSCIYAGPVPEAG